MKFIAFFFGQSKIFHNYPPQKGYKHHVVVQYRTVFELCFQLCTRLYPDHSGQPAAISPIFYIVFPNLFHNYPPQKDPQQVIVRLNFPSFPRFFSFSRQFPQFIFRAVSPDFLIFQAVSPDFSHFPGSFPRFFQFSGQFPHGDAHSVQVTLAWLISPSEELTAPKVQPVRRRKARRPIRTL